MSSAAISRFEEIKDILIYTAVSDHAVTALDLEEYVVDMTRGKMNYVLRALVADDYLISNQKGRSGARLYTATLKTKQLFGLDMKNNQIAVIETAQECKHCLNCTAWVPELTDWDVMQLGYSDEQLYPQQLGFKDQMDFYWYGHSEEKELALWTELQKERIDGGACLTGNAVSMANYPVQQLEVLDMHDVPCTTKVLDLPIQPNFPQAILDAERKA